MTARDGRVFLFGGTDANGDLGSAWVFDPTVERWAALAAMPIVRSGAIATLLPDGSMLVMGGSSVDASGDEAESSRVDRYDPSTGHWSGVAALPEGFFGLQGATTWQGLVVVLGQVQTAGGGTEPRLYVYDPSHNRWSPGPTIPGEAGVAVAAAGAALYLVDDPRIWRWDDQHRKWVAQAPSATHDDAAALVGHDGAIYVVDPDVPVASCTDLHTVIRRYDPRVDRWTTVTTLLTSRHGAVAVGGDGRLYVMGGADTSAQSCGNAELSDPTNEVLAITLAAP